MLESPQFQEHRQLQRAYRAYRVVAGKVLIQGEPPTVIHGEVPGDLLRGEPWVNDWILLDTGNGDPSMGYGFVWVFKTRQAARDFRDQLNSDPRMANAEGSPWRARIAGPWRVAMAKQRLLHFWRYPLRGRLRATQE